MQSTASRPISFLRTIILQKMVLSEVAALLIASVILPIAAQNAVPSTATQATARPRFASPLAHTAVKAQRPNAMLARRGSEAGTPAGSPIYDNGPIDGTTGAWEFDNFNVVSNTFTLTRATSISGMTFGAWLSPGDVLSSASIVISSEPDGGGIIYVNQQVGFEQTGCVLNQAGFNVCTESIANSFQTPELQPGTYWVNLGFANTDRNNAVYWDQNSGIGCMSPGCPSQAYSSQVGTIPSESFILLSYDGSSLCFESQGKLQILYDFNQQQSGGASGVTIDRAGNLYGTTYSGGANAAGFAYKLGRYTGWLLDPLFSFAGGSNGDQPSGVIVGPNGSLYGGAQGGIQNCGTDGSQYCGLVFNLRPKLATCATSLCGWNENVSYRFSSENDGSGTINVSAYDPQGNLYGTTSTGGAQDKGTVFELTPSAGGWTKTTLYGFTGGNDGYNPTQVLLGNDGNLYGVAEGGVFGRGVVFQLTRSGGGWTERVLRAFGSDGTSSPASLVQDSASNLYGIATFDGVYGSAAIFALEKTGPGWTFSFYLVDHSEFDHLNNLISDTAGNLYGTGYDYTTIAGNRRSPNPGGGQEHDSYIFKASYDSNGWHYEDLEFLGYRLLDSTGSLALDADSNLYGTTYTCGANGNGTVWQLSP